MKVLGIDEAGRGPVIGPLIVAGVMIQDGKEVLLGAVKDSKLLTHKKRIELNHLIQEHSEFKIIEVSPKEIDEAVDGDDKKMNLNWLEAHKQAEIINELKPDVAIIDCPSPNCKKYADYLRNLLNEELKNIKLIVEHKADVNYPVCSAAGQRPGALAAAGSVLGTGPAAACYAGSRISRCHPAESGACSEINARVVSGEVDIGTWRVYYIYYYGVTIGTVSIRADYIISFD